MARRLKLRFDDPVAFRTEYAENIVQGGAFIPTRDKLSLREAVVVEIELAFAGTTSELDAEVVHCVTVEQAGAGAGVAVQFLLPAADLRDRFERYVQAGGARGAPAAPAAPAVGADPSERDLSLFEDGAIDLQEEVAEEKPDRRRKKRESARVGAKVESAHATAVGRTRNLSESGVLLSVDGNDLPVGKPVRLTLLRPGGGESLEVSGHVARHLETSGTVAAVAIEFDAPADAEQLAGFVASARADETRRSHGGIAGSIGELGMGDLIQMFGKTARAGTITATSGAEEGVVAFENGRLRYCRLGSLAGAKALARLLSWSEGRFEFHAEVDALPDEPDPIPIEGAILEAARQIDEMRRVEPGTLDPAAKLKLDAKAVAANRDPLSKTEEAVVDLAAAGFTVRRLLDVIPESDSQILDAIRSLAERGLLEIVGGDD